MTQRRWTMEVPTVGGAVEQVELRVRDGKVHTWRKNGGVIEMDPEDVSRLCGLLRSAQAVALQDRGRW